MKDKANYSRTKYALTRRLLSLFSTLALATVILGGLSASVRRSQAAASTDHPLDAARLALNTTNYALRVPHVAKVAVSSVAAMSGNTIYVTTTAQGIANDGQCSLQEAIYSANLDFGVAPSSFNPLVTFDTGCAPGSGDDTIVLQAGQYVMTAPLDDPYNPLGPTANPIVLSNVTIEGNGARLVRANPFRDFTGTPFRAFAVAKRSFADPSNDLGVTGAGTGSLLIRNAHIKGFTAKGGDGGTGGGGGMGAGGAIYVRDASLSLDNCTLEDNGAGGGRGGFHVSGPGGGGGGIGGSGGVAQGDTAFPIPLPPGYSNSRLGSGPGGGGGGARADGGANGFTSQFLTGWATGNGGGGGGTLT
ncbi:MAG TPA: CSLREA domain-containing protein, partial [Pyrinomonadaceae bacterium]|nr:CSLREA domain-containing protein [Pyrinomonadaceae bacterium]